MAEKVWTIGRILRWTEQYFSEKGIETPRLDAEVLLSHVLGKERIYLYVHFDEPLEKGELAAYRELVKGRVQRVPVAYLAGQKEFMGLRFRVNPSVLVPRPETEILVQASLERLKALQGAKAPLLFADIGTGSGAICLSVLHFLPGSRAATVDISGDARSVAEENAAALGLSERVDFLTGDLLEPLEGRTFTAILSNPPYIPDGEISSLPPEVRLHEPRAALAGGPDGMEFYRRLAAEAPALLAPDGFLALEAGIQQAKAVAGLAEENPLIARTEILEDLAGIERVVIAWRGGSAA